MVLNSELAIEECTAEPQCDTRLHPKVSSMEEHPIANIAGQTGYQARTLSDQDGSGPCSNHIHALCDSHFGFRCEDAFIVTLPTSLLVQVPHKRLF